MPFVLIAIAVIVVASAIHHITATVTGSGQCRYCVLHRLHQISEKSADGCAKVFTRQDK